MKLTKQQLKQIIKEELSNSIKEAINLDAPPGQSVNEPEKYPDQSEPFDPFYHDEVEVDKAKLAADLKNALNNFSADQIVSSLERGLEYMGRPGREAFIEIAEIFDDLGKPHHRKHQDI